MPKLRVAVAHPLLHVLAIVLVTFVFYVGSLDNFFYADDFVWLNRVKHLPGNWASVFTLENRYFTPLTYVSFFVNYKLFGLDPYWYHLQDLIFHAANGILLYLLAWKLTKNRLTSFIAAILFVTSFSLPITVFWPSARTDAIMFFFFMAAVIASLQGETDRCRHVPLALYIVALCAKGTALIMPFVLLVLPSGARSSKDRIKELLPYLAVNALYVILLLLVNTLGPRKIATAQGMVSFGNYIKGFAILIMPERFLAGTNPAALTIICAIVLLAAVIFAARLNDSTIRVGVALVAFGLLPLLFTREYSLTGSNTSAAGLLSSPSNRVYLSYAGIALVYGVLLEKMLRSGVVRPIRIVGFLLVLALLCINYHDIHSRNETWRIGSYNGRRDLHTLGSYPDLLTDNSVLLLYNFEGSTGFSTAMINTYFDLQNVEVHILGDEYKDEFTDPDKSPLSNPTHAFNHSSVKLILRCLGNPKTDQFITESNLLLQYVLMQYRDLYANRGNADASRTRLADGMQRLRSVLSRCTKAN